MWLFKPDHEKYISFQLQYNMHNEIRWNGLDEYMDVIGNDFYFPDFQSVIYWFCI